MRNCVKIALVLFLAGLMPSRTCHGQSEPTIEELKAQLAASQAEVAALKAEGARRQKKWDENLAEFEKEVKEDRKKREEFVKKTEEFVKKTEEMFAKSKKDRADMEAKYKKIVADLVEGNKAAVENTKKTHEAIIAIYKKEIDGLRKGLVQAEKDRDAHFKAVLKLTDEMHQLVNEMEVLKQAAGKIDALPVAPDIQGNVVVVHDPRTVEISLGFDNGIRLGHLLRVYRNTDDGKAYIGYIHVRKIKRDAATCAVMARQPVKKGDLVVTRNPKKETPKKGAPKKVNRKASPGGGSASESRRSEPAAAPAR